jgi:hypothetical protein
MPARDGTLRHDSAGDAVKALQRDLNKLAGVGLEVDGEFGPATRLGSRPSSANTT